MIIKNITLRSVEIFMQKKMIPPIRYKIKGCQLQEGEEMKEDEVLKSANDEYFAVMQ